MKQHNKTVSIVIPVFNEEQRIQKACIGLSKLALPRGLKLDEVIFVNDGSTDETKSQITSLKSQINTKIQIISYKKNRGKGYAVKTGMLASNADYTLLCDADMSVPLTDLKLFTKAIKQNTDAIIGTRKTGKSAVIEHQPLYRELLGRGFTKFTQVVLGVQISDFTCGFKLFSKNAKNAIFPVSTIDRWGYDAEIIVLAQKAGFSITEVPVSYFDDRGTKVTLLTAIPQTIIELWKIVVMLRIKPTIATLADTLLSSRLQLAK